MTNGGAAAAAAAAAARRRREQEEEETMTGYSAQELAEGWEFKIVRSATSGFKRPAFLNQVIEEERRAGWTLLEKFDNGRIRLKRPASARASDPGLGFDPYRSRVGMSEAALGLLIGGCALAVAAIAIAIIATAMRH